MRDPGTPRRNPFFEHRADAPADDLGMGWRDDPTEPEPGIPGADQSAGAVGGFATLVALVEGLSEAQPEAAEHLMAAAHEVVLTVKVLVDATEAVLAQQREAMHNRTTAGSDVPGSDVPGSDATQPTASAVDPDGIGGVSYLHRTEGS